MDLHTISFLFGAILMAVGLLGGGFEVKELKVPRVGGFVRGVALLAGVFFVAVGLKNVFSPPQTLLSTDYNRSSVSENYNSDYQRIRVAVSAHLGKSGDAQERLTVLRLFLDGTEVANFLLNADEPSQSTSIELSEEGVYSYAIEGYTEWNVTGDRKIPIQGGGQIDLRAGGTYNIIADDVPDDTTQAWINHLTQQ